MTCSLHALAVAATASVAAASAPVAGSTDPVDPTEPSSPATAPAADDDYEPAMDSRARLVEGFDPDVFRKPIYGEDEPGKQFDVYADKNPVPTQRPLLEWGRDLYSEGPLESSYNLFGSDALPFHHLYLYGDWRTAGGHSNLGVADTARLATRLNLDIDLGLTETERVHALWRPLDENGKFTQVGISGLDEDDDAFRFDGRLDTLFFEGDLTAMMGRHDTPSIPIAVGKVPLLFQNGVWVEDAFTGLAVSFPAKNSAAWDIPNYDLTFFAGFDDVTTNAANPNGGGGAGGERTNIFGVNAFVEALDGYIEAGYGYSDVKGFKGGLDYHNVTASYSRRYGAWLSNSVRAIANFGQNTDGAETADGLLLLVENSLITSKPSTYIPYANFFLGFGTPQSLARDGGAGGVLKNTGINFETDAITAFPALDASGHDAIGGAVGLQYLFNLDRQIVFEVAAQDDIGSDAKTGGSELAFGVRYQQPIPFIGGARSALLRVDAMYGLRDAADEIAGIRVEFRWKF